jgi:hypothetical protein
MWTIIIMLHAASPNVPPTKGSISLVTQGHEECMKVRDTVIKNWRSDQYRVSANCILLAK